MVIVLQEQITDRPQLVEMSSMDGVTWTRLSTITFDQTAIPGLVNSPELSADGCLLLFSTTQSIPYNIYAVARDGAKAFSAPPTKLVAATNAGLYAIDPAIAPDQRRMWFAAQTASSGGAYVMFTGAPP